MEGLRSWTLYENELIKLRQYYDFTYHLYNKEESVIKQMKDEHKISFHTTIGTTNHHVDSLLRYIQFRYPQKLRELVLINLISLTEVYFVRLIKEIYTRDKTYFKINEIIEINVSEIFSYSRAPLKTRF